MKINKLVLNNFRCFEHYEIEFADRFTLLIGDNASGKTAILDALAIGISDFSFFTNLFRIDLNQKRDISISDMRYIDLKMGQTRLRQIVNDMSISINGLFLNQDINWDTRKRLNSPESYSVNIYGNSQKLIETIDKSKLDSNILLPIIICYGTGRLWQKLTYADKETKGPGSRFEGYRNCLDTAIVQKNFFNWFKKQELITLQKNVPQFTLEAVRSAIINMIPNTENIKWDFDLDELVIKRIIQEKIENLPFSFLSDGYRNMIGMVGDIAYRMATLNPQLEAEVIKQTEGIVLIDEIDLHLHPKWQRKVVERLLNTFPKVQFVASSHSPFIIQSLYHRDDVLLWDLDQAKPVSIDSKSIEDIAEHQQGVKMPQQSQRFLDMEKAAEEYYTVLKQIPPATEEEKLRLKNRLNELLMPYSDDPAFQAFLKMERLAVESHQDA